MALIDKKSIVKYDDFQKIQILTGTIKSAEINIKARKPAYVLSIDFGPELGIKISSAQITNYSIESLINKKCIGIINLGDKQIGSIMSQCLILGSTDINGDVLLLNPDKDASLGDKVS